MYVFLFIYKHIVVNTYYISQDMGVTKVSKS